MLDTKDKILLRKCPVCKSGEGKVLHTQSFLLSESNFLPDSYDVACCDSCGFVFADTKASQSDYDRYYKDLSKYESSTMSSGSGGTAHDIVRLKETANEIEKFFPEKRSSILDIGCGAGGLLVELGKLGYSDLNGLDPSPVCVDMINKIGAKGVLGGIYTKNNFDKKFDGILLTHVLEHVCDVQGAIKNILNMLNDGGRLFIEVPDADRYKDFFISPFYFFDVEHINHFSGDSLSNLFAGYDGKVLKIDQKQMIISDTDVAPVTYPAVYIVFEKLSDKTKIVTSLPFSHTAKESVIKHIKDSASASCDPRVVELVSLQDSVVIWGAGQATHRALKNTILGDTNILFFVDNDTKKQGSKLKDRVIFSPDKIKETDATIIICSGLHGQAISKQIKSMGVNNPVLIVA